MDRTARRDRGSALPLLIATVALAAVLVLVGARTAGVVVDDARATTAADAAALAAAADGAEAAHRVARANGGQVQSVVIEPGAATVVVRVGRGRATARAEVAGTWCHDEAGPGTAISYTSPPCPSSPG